MKELTIDEDNIVKGDVYLEDSSEDEELLYRTESTVEGFILNSDGTYSFDSNSEIYQSLSKDETKTIVIPIKVYVEDDLIEAFNFTVTIKGTNDKPVLDDISVIKVNEDSEIIRGTLSSTDIDNHSRFTYSLESTVAGFRLNRDGSYSFDASNRAYQELSVGERRELVIPITVTDNSGGSSTKNLTIQVTGTNDTPTVKLLNENVQIKNELEMSGTIEVEDLDSSTFTYEILEEPEHGEFSVNSSGEWIYNVESTYKGVDKVKVKILDEKGAFVEKSISLRVDNNPINGDKFQDNLEGTEGSDILNGLAGDDKLYSYNGDDFLFGDRGEDRLYGFDGDDKLYSGKDSDYMTGGYGNDTYYFNKGDGEDTIYDRAEKDSADIDKIVLGEGIKKENIQFRREGDDLILVLNEKDSISIKHWFMDDIYKIEEFQFSDESTLTIEDINKLLDKDEKVVSTKVDEPNTGNYLSHSDMEVIIQDISAFNTDSGLDMTNNQTIEDNARMMQILTENSY